MSAMAAAPPILHRCLSLPLYRSVSLSLDLSRGAGGGRAARRGARTAARLARLREGLEVEDVRRRERAVDDLDVGLLNAAAVVTLAGRRRRLGARWRPAALRRGGRRRDGERGRRYGRLGRERRLVVALRGGEEPRPVALVCDAERVPVCIPSSSSPCRHRARGSGDGAVGSSPVGRWRRDRGIGRVWPSSRARGGGDACERSCVWRCVASWVG